MSIQLWRNSGADCYTGWSASGARDAFFLEAEEINPKGQFTSRCLPWATMAAMAAQ